MTKPPIDLKSLSPEQVEMLKEQVRQEDKQRENSIQEQRQAYKELVSENVPGMIAKLEDVSLYLSKVKTEIVRQLNWLIEQKREVYKVETDQKSHTLSTKDGKYRIIIGRKVVRAWDGTESEGVEKVKNWLNRGSNDPESQKKAKVIMNLLKQDKEGNLKPSRAMELYKLKDEIDDEEFSDGVEIIMQAYRETDSALFLEASKRENETEKYKGIPLSLPTVPMLPHEPTKPQSNDSGTGTEIHH